MKILLRIVAIIAASLVLIVGLLAAYLTFVFDPNDYRERLAEQVQRETGRELVIDGDIDLSIVPWLGVELEQVRLGNAEGFGGEPFAQVGRVEVRARLMPLLRSEVEVDRVVLDGLVLNLQRDENGRTNWADLLATADREPEAGAAGSPAEAASDAETTARAAAAFVISGVEIDAAQITWDDREADVRHEVSNLSLKSGEIRPGTRFPLALGFDLTSTQPAFAGRLEWDGQVMLAADYSSLQIEGFALRFDGRGEGLPGGGLTVEVDAEVAADLAAGTLAINDLVARSAGIEARGALQGSGLNDEPRFTGNLAVAEFSPRALLEALGEPVPEVSDPKVLQRASIATDFEATNATASLGNLRVHVDDSTLAGMLRIEDFAQQALRFDLVLDAIDVDRYLPPREPDDTPAAGSPGVAAAAIDPAALRDLNLDGKLAVGELVVSGLKLADLELNVAAANGRMRLAPLSANLYGGRYQGNIALDGSGQTMTISLDESLADVQLAPLLRDLTAEEPRLSGSAHLKARLQARGNDPDAMKRSLDGDAEFRFTDGAVKGINIAQLLREAQARLSGKPAPATEEPNQTDFSALAGTLQIAKGVVRNDDLDARSPLLRVTGSGLADLGAERLDYRVRASVVATLAGQGGKGLDELRGVTVPVRITGSFSDPSYALDLETLLGESVKERARGKLEEELDERLPPDLKENLRRGLGGLLR